MEKGLLGVLAIAAGIVLILVSVFADPLGIGDTNAFGYWQAFGIVVGAGVVYVGIVLRRQAAALPGGGAPREDDRPTGPPLP